MARPPKRRVRGSGAVRQLPSGRWQARTRDDDGRLTSAPMTFDTKLDASVWLADKDGQLVQQVRPRWKLNDFAEVWLTRRDLRPRTRHEYRQLLDKIILPALGEVQLGNLTPARVSAWYATLSPATPTRRSHAYSLLRAVMTTAYADDLISSNPCRVRGAGSTARKGTTTVATLEDLDAIVLAIPARYKAMVLLAAWCGLRFGELTELRRGDLNLDDHLIRVRRGVARAAGVFDVGDPKTRAGIRDVAIPPHLLPALRQHLDAHVSPAPDALVFAARQGGHMASSSLNKVFARARKAAGREELRFHDLRHTGATMAAGTGATLAELMNRIGHSTPSAAMRYQHVARDRDQAIAKALSELTSAARAAE